MLGFDDFVKEIRNRILDYMPDQYGDWNVNVGQVVKNNGLNITGMSINNGKGAFPTMYLEESYLRYQSGVGMQEILQGLASAYEQAIRECPNVRLDMSFESVKDMIFCAVVNAESNQEKLKEIPFDIREDLAVTYRVLVPVDEGGDGSVLIHNSYLQEWGIDKNALQKLARENMRKLLPMEIHSMEEVMARLFEGDMGEGFLSDRGMYVMSNNRLFLGAAYMFDEEALNRAAGHLGGSFYILPSSIHELILLRDNEMINKDALKQMVQDINLLMVSPTEVLSNEIYYYDSEEHCMSMVTDQGQSMEMGM